MREGVVAVLRRAERLLVIKRSATVPMPGYWSPLSGKIEKGETQAEAVAREVREEVGLEVRPLRRVWECPTDDGSYHLYWWTVEEVGGELHLDPREVEETKWVTAEEFEELEPTFLGDREFFARVLSTLVD